MAGSWFGEVPVLKRELCLDDGALGLALLAPAAASLVGMHVAGRAAARRGSGPVARLGGVLLPLALVLPALAGNLGWLVLALLPFGLLQGLVDVAQNTHGVALQRRLGTPIMSRLHAACGVGGITGSVLASGAVAVGLTPRQHLGALAVVTSGSLAVGLRRLLPGRTDVPAFVRR
ncbi:MAG: MFS transporter, partial [Acidimicrobiales bacterium]